MNGSPFSRAACWRLYQSRALDRLCCAPRSAPLASAALCLFLIQSFIRSLVPSISSRASADVVVVASAAAPTTAIPHIIAFVVSTGESAVAHASSIQTTNAMPDNACETNNMECGTRHRILMLPMDARHSPSHSPFVLVNNPYLAESLTKCTGIVNCGSEFHANRRWAVS